MSTNPHYLHAPALTASPRERKEHSKHMDKILSKRKKKKKNILKVAYVTAYNFISNNRKVTRGRPYIFIPTIDGNGKPIRTKHSVND